MTPLDLANAEIERLRAENEKLREDLRFYKREAELEQAQNKAYRLRRILGLGPQTAWLLARLTEANGRVMARLQLLEEIPGDRGVDRNLNLISVHVRRIRIRLGDDAIQTLVGHGYGITDKGKLLVDRILSGEDVTLPTPQTPRRKNERRRLSETAVKVMRNAMGDIRTIKALAAAYNCSMGLVWAVRSRTVYADIP